MLVRLYVIRYYFEINKGDGHVAYQVFEEMGQMIDNFSIGFQCKFQEILQNQLTKEYKYFHRRESKLNNYDYAIDVYSIQSQMEIEPPKFETPKFEQQQPPASNQIQRQSSFKQIDNFDFMQQIDDFDHDMDYDDELLFRQVVENSRREAEQLQQQEQKQQTSQIIEEVIIAAPEVKEKPPLNINYSSLPKSTHLTVRIPDVYEGFIQWVTRKISTGMSERTGQSQSSAKDDQSVILMVHTLFSSLRTYSKLRLSRPQEPNHQLYYSVWEIIINSIKSLNIQKTLGFTKNPEFPVKLVVILLIFGNKQLQQKDQPLNAYKNAMEAVFDGFPDIILSVLSRLQESFSQKLGSVYQQQSLQAAEKQRRESFQPKREDETRQQIIQRYNQLPSHSKAINHAPPVEIMTIKKCKNMINDLLRGEGSINESSKIFEISDQLIYVYLTKILINLGRYSDFLKNQVVQNKSQWGSFICKALLDKITKSLSTAELKSLLCDVMRKDEYYRVKDFNLYETQLQTLDQNLPDQSSYKNQKLCYQSLKILSKIAKKRPQVWRNYYDENRDSIQIVKKALNISQCAALALQMLETLI